MVSVSPRLPDLDSDEEPESTDPRFTLGFRSLSIDSAGYSDHDPLDDERAFAGTPDSGASRRRRRQRQSDVAFDNALPYQYQTVADGTAFRLVVVQPGTGSSPLQCNLIWEDSKSSAQRDYCCLSYAWQSTTRDAAILCDGFRFSVTSNLLKALQNLRRPRGTLLIWIDQICINQDDDRERGHQVSIMKNIFNRAHKTYVWLGEADDRSDKLCEYAKKMRRGGDSPQATRIMGQREMKDAIQRLLGRSWFQRVWVIPEVALSKHTSVVIGPKHISWDNLVRLIRDVQVAPSPHFDKQRSLLGNPRQRVAIVTQMINSQKEGLLHTDITQLLILGKSGRATDVRDMIYAFYGVTLLTTPPDYSRSAARIYVDIVEMYIENLLWIDSYAKWHSLTESQKTFQLMSILYSAGALHQHYALPSWVPDWTYAWHLAPVWCKSTPNFVTGSGKDEWSIGIRSEHRAGGGKVETYEILRGSSGMHQLRLSAYIFDTVILVNEITPASTPGQSQQLPASPADAFEDTDTSTLRYGRHFITTAKNRVGLATPGVAAGDEIAVILGGDVPFILRPILEKDGTHKAYTLLCECYMQSQEVMQGDLLRQNWTLTEDIVII